MLPRQRATSFSPRSVRLVPLTLTPPDVSRSTFYAHYETKDDLLLGGLEHLTAGIELHAFDDPSAPDAILPSLGVFRHVAEHHELLKAMLGSRGIDLVHKAAQEALTARAMSAIERRAVVGEKNGIPPEARAAFVAGSLMAFLEWRLDNDMPHTPERMDEFYRQMTASA